VASLLVAGAASCPGRPVTQGDAGVAAAEGEGGDGDGDGAVLACTTRDPNGAVDGEACSTMPACPAFASVDGVDPGAFFVVDGNVLIGDAFRSVATVDVARRAIVHQQTLAAGTLFLRGDTLLVATTEPPGVDASSGALRENASVIIVVDVSDALSPREVARFGLPGFGMNGPFLIGADLFVVTEEDSPDWHALDVRYDDTAPECLRIVGEGVAPPTGGVAAATTTTLGLLTDSAVARLKLPSLTPLAAVPFGPEVDGGSKLFRVGDDLWFAARHNDGTNLTEHFAVFNDDGSEAAAHDVGAILVNAVFARANDFIAVLQTSQDGGTRVARVSRVAADVLDLPGTCTAGLDFVTPFNPRRGGPPCATLTGATLLLLESDGATTTLQEVNVDAPTLSPGPTQALESADVALTADETTSTRAAYVVTATRDYAAEGEGEGFSGNDGEGEGEGTFQVDTSIASIDATSLAIGTATPLFSNNVFAPVVFTAGVGATMKTFAYEDSGLVDLDDGATLVLRAPFEDGVIVGDTAWILSTDHVTGFEIAPLASITDAAQAGVASTYVDAGTNLFGLVRGGNVMFAAHDALEIRAASTGALVGSAPSPHHGADVPVVDLGRRVAIFDNGALHLFDVDDPAHPVGGAPIALDQATSLTASLGVDNTIALETVSAVSGTLVVSLFDAADAGAPVLLGEQRIEGSLVDVTANPTTLWTFESGVLTALPFDGHAFGAPVRTAIPASFLAAAAVPRGVALTSDAAFAIARLDGGALSVGPTIESFGSTRIAAAVDNALALVVGNETLAVATLDASERPSASRFIVGGPHVGHASFAHDVAYFAVDGVGFIPVPLACGP
jgi:hypothetical protein